MGSWQVPSSQQTPDGDFGSTPTVFPAVINGTTHTLVGVANKNGIYYALDGANVSAGHCRDWPSVGTAGEGTADKRPPRPPVATY